MLMKRSQSATPSTRPKDFPYDGTGWLRKEKDQVLLKVIIDIATHMTNFSQKQNSYND